MNTHQFENNVASLVDECRKILSGAATEYSVETDRLENFNQLRSYGVKPEVVCLIYLTKHIDGIKNYILRDVTNQRDSIRGRIVDAINYLAILNAILIETEDRDVTEPKNVDALNVLDNLDNLYDNRNRYAQRKGAIG